MGLGDALKKLEDGLSGLLEPSPTKSASHTESPPSAPPRLQPLLVRKALLERIRGEVIRVEGNPVFPFMLVDITLLAQDERAAAHLTEEFLTEDRFKRELERMFSGLRVKVSKELKIRFSLVPKMDGLPLEAREEGFFLRLSLDAPTLKVTRPNIGRARLRVEVGDASPRDLPLERARTYIGRQAEVPDRNGRVIRRNDLVFAAEGSVNTTVSRAHAHIRYDADKDEYRLFDDQSRDGTLLIREGRRVVIPKGAARGTLLQSGDEIYLGQARLRFER